MFSNLAQAQNSNGNAIQIFDACLADVENNCAYTDIVQSIPVTGQLLDLITCSDNGVTVFTSACGVVLNAPLASGPPNVNSNNSPQCPSNSSINMDSLALQETIPLVGILFHLNYSSDRLQVILKGIATGSGEANFWQTIESTNLDELAEKLKREFEVNQLKDHQQHEKTLA